MIWIFPALPDNTLSGIELKTSDWQAKRDHLTQMIAAGARYTEVRQQYKNILILGILLGLNKANLYKINHYLSSIINKLKLFWQEIMLDSFAKYLKGKILLTALI